MRVSVKTFVAMSGLLILILPVASGAYQPTPDTSGANFALAGIKAIAVNVADVDPNYLRYGVDPDQLKAMVEERLRATGIEIIPEATAISDAHSALLKVSFKLAHANHKYHSYSVSLKLKQKLQLPNSSAAFTVGTIWSDGEVGAIEAIELRRLNGSIAGLLERFVADYRSQNG